VGFNPIYSLDFDESGQNSNIQIIYFVLKLSYTGLTWILTPSPLLGIHNKISELHEIAWKQLKEFFGISTLLLIQLNKE
jgi:hypothetical protein